VNKFFRKGSVGKRRSSSDNKSDQFPASTQTSYASLANPIDNTCRIVCGEESISSVVSNKIDYFAKNMSADKNSDGTGRGINTGSSRPTSQMSGFGGLVPTQTMGKFAKESKQVKSSAKNNAIDQLLNQYGFEDYVRDNVSEISSVDLQSLKGQSRPMDFARTRQILAELLGSEADARALARALAFGGFTNDLDQMARFEFVGADQKKYFIPQDVLDRIANDRALLRTDGTNSRGLSFKRIVEAFASLNFAVAVTYMSEESFSPMMHRKYGVAKKYAFIGSDTAVLNLNSMDLYPEWVSTFTRALINRSAQNDRTVWVIQMTLNNAKRRWSASGKVNVTLFEGMVKAECKTPVELKVVEELLSQVPNLNVE
jgi:hypothetical protein